MLSAAREKARKSAKKMNVETRKARAELLLTCSAYAEIGNMFLLMSKQDRHFVWETLRGLADAFEEAKGKGGVNLPAILSVIRDGGQGSYSPASGAGSS